MLIFIFTILLIAACLCLAVYMEYIDLSMFLDLFKSDKDSVIKEQETNPLKCRVRYFEENGEDDKISIEIKGKIRSKEEKAFVAAEIRLFDVTDGIKRKKIVQSSSGVFQGKGSPEFLFESNLGKLISSEMFIEDWLEITKINPQFIRPARRGERELELDLAIRSKDSGKVIAKSKSLFTFMNENPGYIDLQDKIQKAKSLAVTLGFAVSAADNKLFKCQIDTIKEWARKNIENKSKNDRLRMEKAMDKIVNFFQNGNTMDIKRICDDLVEISPTTLRYEILELCLKVAKANGTAFKEEIEILKNLSCWLKVDAEKFHEMVEKHLPIDMHEVKDMEFILGINDEMTEDERRKLINKEYHKWNSRVTNFDNEVQSQADNMLELLAEARNLYVTK